jgi:putative acetyltransferase
MKWKIRQEIEGDEAAITQVVSRAFEGKSYADESDAKLVDALRDAGALILSLVATHKGQIIGQVALSPATIGEGRYLCVGPLSVLPDHQRKGVGTALMGHALGVAQVYGRDGVVLQGDLKYYARFGFETFPSVAFAGEGAQFIQVLPWGGTPSGEVKFHPVFNG